MHGAGCYRLHLVTKHRVFSGPGFALAQELGDAASGGQVLLSHDAWLNLRHNMCDAGFPQVEQLGMYKLEAWLDPFWIYQVSSAKMNVFCVWQRLSKPFCSISCCMKWAILAGVG